MFFQLAVAALPFLAQSTFATSCTRSYTVQAGDICDSISAAKNVSTYQLAVVNPQIDSACDNLSPGQVICLGLVANEDCSTTYVVKPDDSCGSIASAAGVNSTMLSLNNPQINDDCSNIYVGEVLCTAKTVQVPPAPAGVTPAATIPATATAPHPTATSSATSLSIASSSHTSTHTSSVATSSVSSDDGDDSQLPWCDEL